MTTLAKCICTALLVGLGGLGSGCAPADSATTGGASGAGVSGGVSGSGLGGAPQTGAGGSLNGTAGTVNDSGGAAGSGGALAGTGGAGGAGSGGAAGNAGSGGAPAVGGAATGGNGAGGATGGAPNGVVVGGPDGYHEFSTFNAPPEATRQPGAPKATLDTFVYTSPTIFGRGQSGPVERDVAVFIPAQYVPNTEVPFIVLHDGREQLNTFHTDIVLENLIAQKKLPVMAALFVNRPNNNDSGQRSLEYDCIDSDYSEYMIKEIIPAVKVHHPELKLTDDPNGRATLGKSSGAPAAFTMAWLRPDLYRRVVTFNGSWINICRDGAGAAGYPDMIRATDPAKPLRLYLFSGSGDNANYPAVNQAMADAFKAKGMPWRYDFGQGATHNSTYAASRITDALLWIWAGYPL